MAVAQWDAPKRARLIGLLTDAIAAVGVGPPTGLPGPSRELLARDEELRRLFESAGAQPPEVQQRIRNELDRLIDPYRHDEGIDVPVSVRVASARRVP